VLDASVKNNTQLYVWALSIYSKQGLTGCKMCFKLLKTIHKLVSCDCLKRVVKGDNQRVLRLISSQAGMLTQNTTTPSHPHSPPPGGELPLTLLLFVLILFYCNVQKFQFAFFYAMLNIQSFTLKSNLTREVTAALKAERNPTTVMITVSEDLLNFQCLQLH
jgi:hypothetical protein